MTGHAPEAFRGSPHLEPATAASQRMEELDWQAGIALTTYGLRIGIQVNDLALLPLVLERLPVA